MTWSRNWNRLSQWETWPVNALALWNNFWVKDFISFYIQDPSQIDAITQNLAKKGVSVDMPQEELEKSIQDFEEILRKNQTGEPLKKGEELEKNIFFIIFQEIQNFLLTSSQDQFREFIQASWISRDKKRKIIELNERISRLWSDKKDEYTKELEKFLKWEIKNEDIKSNPLIELSIALQEALEAGVTNIDLDTWFKLAFPKVQRRKEIEWNVKQILWSLDINEIKKSQDYKDFVIFLEEYQSGKISSEKEKELLFSGNKLYIAFQYIVSEFIKETLKTFEESSYLGVPPQLWKKITRENLELTKLFLLKYPTDAFLMLLAFNGVFFWSQLILSGVWISPASMMSKVPSEMIAFLLSVLSVKLRTDSKNQMMQWKWVMMAIAKSSKLPQLALLLVLVAHWIWAASVFSRTGSVNSAFSQIDTDFKAFWDTLRTVIWWPGKETESELGKLSAKFLEKCIEVINTESASWNQWRPAWFWPNSYAKYYLCFGTSQTMLSKFTWANIPTNKWPAFSKSQAARTKITSNINVPGLTPLWTDEHINDFIARRIQFFRTENKEILERIFSNEKLIMEYKNASSKWFIGNLIDYYIYQTSFQIEDVEWPLNNLSWDATKLKNSYELLKQQLTNIRELLVEWLNEIDKTGVIKPGWNVIDITIPSLTIDTKVIDQIWPQISTGLEMSRKISTQPTELYGILQGFYGVPLALTILIGSLVVALTAETWPLVLSRGMMRRRWKEEANILEAFLPNLIKNIRTIVKKVKQQLDDSQMTMFLWVGDISEDQIMEWLVKFLEKNAKLAMGTESTVEWFKRWTMELLNPFDHSANWEKYNNIITALEKLQSPKWLLEFLWEVLPWLNQILWIYRSEVRIWDLTKSKPDLWAIRKLPDTRSIAVSNNLKQSILSNRRRKVGIEYMIEALTNWTVTIESIKWFISREEGDTLKQKNVGEIIAVLEKMKRSYEEKTSQSIENFRDVAKISDIDLTQIDEELAKIPQEDELRKRIDAQMTKLQSAISERKWKEKWEIHTFEITSHVNVDINVIRFIIWDIIEALS